VLTARIELFNEAVAPVRVALPKRTVGMLTDKKAEDKKYL